MPGQSYFELLEGLPDQFNPKVAGRTLILDADSIAYKCATTVKRLDTAINKFHMMVLEQKFLAEAEFCIAHLTAANSRKSNRGDILGWYPYQENRKSTERPALLEPLREAVSSEEFSIPEYTCMLHTVLEADDACMIDAYRLKHDAVLYSEDKDLRQTIYPYSDPYTGQHITAEGVGSVWMHVTEGGSYDIHGIGRLFFWAQMLRGDPVDRVRGLDKYEGKNIGPAITLELLERFNNQPLETESEVANLVLRLYKEIDQNPLPEGYLLHMMRGFGDSFMDVLNELKLEPDVQSYIQECLGRHWFRRAE